ncbi:MAG TPA: RsmG family class I SAM-dependent methyltransferase [Thermoanaerobaculia bacterium]|nr:RsmG family class I SAM-dependent methyltransferase [Thermoanaerobaculia bacterium]
MSGSAILAALERLAPEFGVAPAPALLSRVETYLEDLVRWNASTNLVGRLTDDELASHALESLLAARWLEPADRVLDIGSGGGFPGIPLAVAGFDVTLLEPRSRRAAFLRHVLRRLPGTRARVRTARLEEMGRERFTAATVRGVGDLPGTLGNADFLENDGKLLVWTAAAASLKHDLRLGFALSERLPIPLSERREIVLFRKCSTWNNAAPNG